MSCICVVPYAIGQAVSRLRNKKAPPPRTLRNIYVGRKRLGHVLEWIFGGPVVGAQCAFAKYHWAIRIHETWYEFKGTSSLNSGEKNVCLINGPHSAKPYRSALGVLEQVHVGHTTCTEDEIEAIIRRWIDSHPKYGFFNCNCQHFVEYLGRKIARSDVINLMPCKDTVKAKYGSAVPSLGIYTLIAYGIKHKYRGYKILPKSEDDEISSGVRKIVPR